MIESRHGDTKARFLSKEATVAFSPTYHERGRKKERLRGRSLDIAPSHTPIYYYRKGSRILVVDLSRKLLTHVERPGI
jgi:hypothetical protein